MFCGGNDLIPTLYQCHQARVEPWWRLVRNFQSLICTRHSYGSSFGNPSSCTGDPSARLTELCIYFSFKHSLAQTLERVGALAQVSISGPVHLGFRGWATLSPPLFGTYRSSIGWWRGIFAAEASNLLSLMQPWRLWTGLVMTMLRFVSSSSQATRRQPAWTRACFSLAHRGNSEYSRCRSELGNRANVGDLSLREPSAIESGMTPCHLAKRPR